jgi:hypothetical protein
MPLPVIFKFLSDTSGLKFGEVDRGLNDMNISSQKAGQAVKSLASVIRSGQEPVEALANSVSNLTRAFGLGVGATVAVVGVVEVVKSFISESQKLNTVAEQINGTLKTFQDTAVSLDFGGAITQVKSLTKALDEARGKIGERTDILGKVGKTIADTFFGGSRERAEAGLANLKAAQGQAKFSASIALDKRIEAMEAAKVSKFEAQRLAIFEKYREERRKAQEIGLLESDLRKLDALELEELRKLEMADLEEKGKILEEQLQEEKRQTEKINEIRIRDEERINNLRKQGTSELIKGMESIAQQRLGGAGSLLERISGAAQTLGLGAVSRFIERGRAEREKIGAENVLEQAGIDPFFARRGRIGMGAEAGLTGLLDIEAESKRQADEKLFNSVYGIEQAVMELKNTIEDKLGVPILRSAAGA